MPKFGGASLKKLAECHSLLQVLFNDVIKYYDCQVICGYRGEKEQNEAYNKGTSTKKYPESKHNKQPSIAVDVIPYPVNWNDKRRFYHFGGYVKATADKMGIAIRWGGDWDIDNDLDDQSFMDLPHFELLLKDID